MQTTQQQLYFGSMNLDRNRDRRMVFYGRVSTQHEQQKDALSNQMQWYDDPSQESSAALVWRFTSCLTTSGHWTAMANCA